MPLLTDEGSGAKLFIMPRGRPRTRQIDDVTETSAPRTVRRRGPNRKTLTVTAEPDSFAETKSLVTAILKSRGDRGATQETLQAVIAWGRSVRNEEVALRELSQRQRRPKASDDAERIAKNEMNRALLDGILDGLITLDVSDSGDLSFRYTTPTIQEFTTVEAEDIVATE